jgi:hypothetical protein
MKLDVQKMGYGSRAVDLLIQYFQGEISASIAGNDSSMFGGEGGELPNEQNVHTIKSTNNIQQNISNKNRFFPKLKLFARNGFASNQLEEILYLHQNGCFYR